jgi:hypothetical protein
MRGIINTYTNNMSYKGYELIYVNGCSHCQGGGLEEPAIRGDSIRPVYEKKYDVSWKDRAEVNFANRLSELIGIPYINEAESGGGTDRVVRMAYKFLLDNWHRKNKLLLILEKPDASRSEIYFNKTKSYYIVNSWYDGIKKTNQFNSATRGYFNRELEKEDALDRGHFKTWFENHFDMKEHWLKVEQDFVGLYSFCKQNAISIKVMTGNDVYFKDCFHKDDIIKFKENNRNYDIATWCHDNKKTIKHEIEGYSNDGHPGYFGHIEYAKLLKNFLDEKLKPSRIILNKNII